MKPMQIHDRVRAVRFPWVNRVPDLNEMLTTFAPLALPTLCHVGQAFFRDAINLKPGPKDEKAIAHVCHALRPCRARLDVGQHVLAKGWTKWD
jgi:hypothetical protein